MSKGSDHSIYVLLAGFVFFFILWGVQEYRSIPPEKGDAAPQYNHSIAYSDEFVVQSGGSFEARTDHSDAAQHQTSDGEPYHEFVKNKRDLNAQEGMWRAANLLVYLTVIQISVGALTIAFLAWTLSTQRQELRQAKRQADLAESSQKPFVAFSVDAQFVKGKKGTSEGPFEEFYVRPVIKNYGKSPATKVNYWVHLHALDEDSNTYTHIGGKPHGQDKVISAGGDIPMSNFPRVKTEFYSPYFTRLYAAGCTLSYSDIGFNELVSDKTTYFRIVPMLPQDGEGRYLEIKEISVEEFKRLRDIDNERRNEKI